VCVCLCVFVCVCVCLCVFVCVCCLCVFLCFWCVTLSRKWRRRYANVLLPGQELAVHTDVPEFRGASRKTLPQWLLVAMHHSQLFERWRVPIATGVTWWSDSEQSPSGSGSQVTSKGFVLYPQGVRNRPDVWNVKCVSELSLVSFVS